MKKKILWGLSVLPLAVTAVLFSGYPDRVPMHYNLAGEIDRWGAKYEQFILPIVILLFALFNSLVIRFYEKKMDREIDEKEQKAAKNNASVLSIVAIVMTLQFDVLHFAFFYAAYTAANSNATSMSFDIYTVLAIGLAVFCLVAGNYLPKARRNSVVGLRTVWSTKNDQVWATSQRMTGKLMVVSGILVLAATVFLQGVGILIFTLAVIMLVAVAATVYSYQQYQKYKG